MSIKATPLPATSPSLGRGGGGGGATVLCSHQVDLCNRRQLLSLNRPSAANLLDSRFGLRPSCYEGPFLAKTYSHSLRNVFITRAADSTQPSTAAATAGKAIVPDEEFSLAKVSFGVIGLGLGVSLLSYGFGAYFTILPGSEWSAIMLTYGFPLAVIGMALKYAELKPVPCITYADAEKLRETCATPILKQVRSDVIRFRYGDEQHLEEALKRIFQYGLGGGIPRRSAPILQMIREEVTEEGKYSLVLVFEAKSLELSDFVKRQAKFASFFGPGITAEIGEGGKDLYEVRLTSDTVL